MKINAEFELEFSMKEDIASIVTNKVVVVTGLYYGYGYIIIIIIYTNYFEDLHHAKIFLLCDVIFQVNKYIYVTDWTITAVCHQQGVDGNMIIKGVNKGNE